MKKILLTIALMSLTFSNVIAQKICGTPDPENYENFQNLVIDENIDYDQPICINVFFHIIRNTNGTGGFDENQLASIIDNLNQFFNTFGIYFSKLGFDYIDNSDYLQVSENESGTLAQINNNPNAINYYIVNSLWANIAGTALSIPSNRLIIRGDYALTTTSPHEVGHCLNLFHTFQGTASGTSGCPEAIDGSNCSSCGDQVCDTPADANIGMNGGYSPDMTNIMSYYTNRNHFTNGQAKRMKLEILNNPLLQSLIGDSCFPPTISGNQTICNSSNTSYVLQHINDNVIWDVSNNLDIVSSNNTTITVKPKANANGEGFIKAILTNKTIQKNIWIGKTKVFVELESDMGGTSNWAKGYLKGVNSSLESQNISFIHWEKLSSTNGGTMSASDNSTEVFGQGPNNYWTVNGRVHVTNSCGITQFDFVLTPPPCPPSGYIIEPTGDDIYTFRPIPCDERLSVIGSQYENISNIISISVFDLHGNKVVMIKNKNSVNLKNLKPGIYIINAIDDLGNIITKKIKK